MILCARRCSLKGVFLFIFPFRNDILLMNGGPPTVRGCLEATIHCQKLDKGQKAGLCCQLGQRLENQLLY